MPISIAARLRRQLSRSRRLVHRSAPAWPKPPPAIHSTGPAWSCCTCRCLSSYATAPRLSPTSSLTALHGTRRYAADRLRQLAGLGIRHLALVVLVYSAVWIVLSIRAKNEYVATVRRSCSAAASMSPACASTTTKRPRSGCSKRPPRPARRDRQSTLCLCSPKLLVMPSSAASPPSPPTSPLRSVRRSTRSLASTSSLALSMRPSAKFAPLLRRHQ